jgi:hypothetical protein
MICWLTVYSTSWANARKVGKKLVLSDWAKEQEDYDFSL